MTLEDPDNDHGHDLDLGMITSPSYNRINQLKDFARELNGLELNQYGHILLKLSQSLERYHDSGSIRAVHEILNKLFELSPVKIEPVFTLLMAKLVSKQMTLSLDSATIYNYVGWILLTLKNSLAKGFKGPSILSLIDSLARALEWLEKSSFYLKATQKVAGLLKHSDLASLVLEMALSVETMEKEGSRYAILLGLALQSIKNVETLPSKAIVSYFIKNILSSKSVISDAQLNALDILYKTWITQDVFNNEIVPISERLFLRSPEVALKVLVYTLSHTDFDLSGTCLKYADTLLNHFKSTNEAVKRDAQALYRLLLSRCIQESVLNQVAQIIKNAFTSKSPTPEIKSVFYGLFESFLKTREVSLCVTDTLQTLAAKEANEGPLTFCVAAWAVHANSLIMEPGVNVNPLLAFLASGLGEPKGTLRRPYLFALQSLSNLVRLPEVTLAGITTLCAKLLDQINKNPLVLSETSKDTPQLIEAYLSIQTLLRLSPPKNAKVLTDSVILQEKFYSKLLNTDQENLIAVQTLGGLFTNSICLDALLANANILSALVSWAFLKTSPNARRFFGESIHSLMLSPAFSKHDTLLSIALQGLYPFVEQEVLSEGFSWPTKTVKSSNQVAVRVQSALFSLLPKSAPKAWLETAILKMILFCNFPVLTRVFQGDFWIQVCLRAGCDPNALLVAHSKEMLNQWMTKDMIIGGLYNSKSTHREATLSAILLMTEVVPSLVFETMIPTICQHLNSEHVAVLEKRDILIWKTPADVLFEDPLAQKDEEEQVRGLTADQKWERQLQKDIAAKRGKTERSLSKAERQLQAEQMTLEASIRSHVQGLKMDVDVAVISLTALLEGVASSYDQSCFEALTMWLSRIFDTLLGLVVRENQTESAVLAGESGVSAFKKLISLVLGHFGKYRDVPKVTNILLRCHEVNASIIMPSYARLDFQKMIATYLEEMEEAFSLAEPLPAQYFCFLLPMIEILVFKRAAASKLKSKSQTELNMAIADLIVAHSSLPGPHTIIPRRRIISVLKELMAEYPALRPSARDALLGLSIAVFDAFELVQESEGQEGTTIEVEAETALICQDLLDGFFHSEAFIREAFLDAVAGLPLIASTASRWNVHIWIACHDENEDIAEKANSMWEDVNGTKPLSRDLIPNVMEFCHHSETHLRESAARALGNALASHKDLIDSNLQILFESYIEKAKEITPQHDRYGMIIPESLNREDEWRARSGVAKALLSIVPTLETEVRVKSLFAFLVDQVALGDRNDEVASQMLETGLAAIHVYGKQFTEPLLALLDGYLNKPAHASKTHDRVRQSVVLLFGTLAQHFPPTDKRVSEVVENLLKTLTTPSEVVQIAVSQCLPPLIKMNKSQAQGLIETLLNSLFHSEKYGDRRGAAYGLAGVVRGYGIGALKEFGILNKLRDAVEDKKNIPRREGALFAYETLSFSFGRMFEPFVIQLLPHLLVCFGDSNRQIRDATEDACRVIMSKLSAYCVKLLLPSLLNGLVDKAWRTQIGSIEVMSSMSSLAPRQLSQSLPTIVPRLCGALSDSHQKVQEAAKQALVQFGAAIKNPEIHAQVQILLGALVDPNNKTHPALASLLETTFVHYIDAPSLALLVPIIHRGMKERSAETKRKAAQIMGNMASLTESGDLVPYLSSLVPMLKEVLTDPVPEARATAAHAFGSMVRTLGEDKFPGLVAELLNTLKSDTSGVDRSGAAQGLSEVVAGVGLDRLGDLMPEIIENTRHPRSYVREGFMTLLVYLPGTFQEQFASHLDVVIQPILRGLADESEAVRGVSLKAGQVIIRGYAKSSITIFLPSLEKGLFDDNWRIRQSSLQLLGDLLFRIAGVSNKVEEDDTGEEEEGLGSDQGRQALKAALGEERFETVLASIYIARADSSAIVRQASLHTWKAIISNTPKTLKEIMPVVMTLLIESLASSSIEKQGVAARTLGELVRKMGEIILNDVMPIFEKGLTNQDATIREGVCLGMTEIMRTGGKTHILDFIGHFTGLIRTALVDQEPLVREAAAQAFDVLHQHIGAKAVEDIVPALLKGLSTQKTGYELEALRELLAVRSPVIFPVLIPSLITVPITSNNAQALASLIPVAGSALTRKLAPILQSLLDSLNPSNVAFADVERCITVLFESVKGSDAVHQVMSFLQETLQEGTTVRKMRACDVLNTFFGHATESIDAYISDWLRTLIAMLSGIDGDLVMRQGWIALDSLVKRLKKDDMDRYVSDVRKGMREAEFGLMPSEEVPGYNLPKGISPLLPILLQGLMYGSTDVREQSALGIGELVSRTAEENLKPFVTQITGPLIRVVGDRIAPQTKSAILQTLAILLTKVPAMLKPFLPQLQRTFVKSLTETGGSSTLRDRASHCLTLLIPLQPRLDPLVTELSTTLKSITESKIKASIWDALFGLLNVLLESNGTKTISEASNSIIESMILQAIQHGAENEIEERMAASKCFGSLCAYKSIDSATALVSSKLLTVPADWWHHQANLFCLNQLAQLASKVLIQETLIGPVVSLAMQSVKEDKSQLMEASVDLLGSLVKLASPYRDQVISSLIAASDPSVGSTDARREAILSLKDLAKFSHSVLDKHIGTLVPTLMASVRDRTIPVKLAAERALVYALQLKMGDDVLQSHLLKLDYGLSKSIGDYARRVLIKISAKDSDDEDDFVFS